MLIASCPECKGSGSIIIEEEFRDRREGCQRCRKRGYIVRDPNPSDPAQVRRLAWALFESSDERKALPKGELFTIGALQDAEIRTRFERQAGSILSFLSTRIEEL